MDVTLGGNSTSAGAGYALVSSGTLTLAGGSNITLSQNGNAVTIIGGAGGTGAGIFGIAGSNASTATSGTVVFANSNNLTFGLAGNTITASASFVQSAQTGISGIAGSGASTAVSGTVQFANSNGLTFGLNGNTITGSYTVPVTNSFTGGVGTDGNTLGTTGTVSNGILFVGGNNITLSQSSGAGGATVTISGPNAGGAQTGISGIAGSGASTVTAGTVQFANSNGVTFGLNGSTMTASYSQSTTPPQTGISGIAGSGASTAVSGTVQFANSNNVTFGLAGNTITASASFSQSSQPAQTGISGIAGSGTATATSGTVIFSNSNNFTFGLSGNTMTASYTVPAAQTGISGIAGSGASTAVSGTVQFQNSNNITFGLNGNTITASASFAQTAQTGISGIAGSGASTAVSGTVQFANSNNVTFGLSGNTITASFSAGGAAAATARYMALHPNLISYGVAGNLGNMSIQRFQNHLHINATECDYCIGISAASTGAGLTASVYLAVYTLANATSANLASSTSYAWQFNSQNIAGSAYASYSGVRYQPITMAAWSMTPGDYLAGFLLTTTSSQTSANITFYGKSGPTLQGYPGFGAGNPYSLVLGDGVLSTTQSVLFLTGASGYVDQASTANLQPFLRFLGT